MKQTTRADSAAVAVFTRRDPILRTTLIAVALLALSVFGKASAGTLVCDPGALNSELAKAGPGTEVVMCSKTWSDVNIRIDARGTASAPVRLVAERPGSVVLVGSSTVSMGGSYVEVDGLKFTGTYSGDAHSAVTFKTGKSECDHCRLTNTTVIAYNPPVKTKLTGYVEVWGQYNRVDHNYFTGKTNLGQIINVKRVQSGPNYHRIDHNFFSRPLYGENGAETIRIGQRESLTSSYTIIEDNYFFEADGEGEMISLKSSNNIVRHNTIDSSRGAIVLRQGNSNLVEGNFIFGRGRFETSGIRVCGENHVIVNNYISGVNPPSSFRGGIVLMNGQSQYVNDEHSPVKNVLIAFNTIVDSSNSLAFGVGRESVVPSRVTVANNIFSNYKGELLVEEKHVSDVTFVNNVVNSRSGTLNLANVMKVDPKLIADSDGIERPSTDSPVINAARETFNVTRDMDGQLRRAVSDVGADQREGEGMALGAIGRCEVGPVGYDPSGFCNGQVAPPSPPSSLTVS